MHDTVRKYGVPDPTLTADALVQEMDHDLAAWPDLTLGVHRLRTRYAAMAGTIEHLRERLRQAESSLAGEEDARRLVQDHLDREVPELRAQVAALRTTVRTLGRLVAELGEENGRLRQELGGHDGEETERGRDRVAQHYG